MNMKINLISIVSLSVLLFLGFFPGQSISFGAEKVRLGTALKGVPHFDITPWAAEEKGFWKEQGLEVEWIPFRGATDMHQAVAAGALEMGIGDTIAAIQAFSRGVPLLLVADFPAQEHWYIWVLSKGPIREPKDLKGARIGTSRFGGSAYAFGQFLVKTLGIEKDVKFIAIGAIPERVAALKAGAIDAFMLTFPPVANLMVAGEIRGLVSLRDYLPKEWMDNMVFAQKEFLEKRPELVKKVLRAVFQSVDFVRQNRAWSMAKLKANYGFSEEAARIASEIYPGKGGAIEPKSLENVRNFLIDYGLIPKEKAPAVEKLYSNDYLS